MKSLFSILILLVTMILMNGCKSASEAGNGADARIPVIFDTDANNELDDQHALAYLLLNDSTFNVVGVTTNATWGGGEIEAHWKEASRVVEMVGWKGKVPVIKGANGNFSEISDQLDQPEFDGREAVDFMIGEAMRNRDERLLLLPVGKLTNVALALKKEPSIADRIRVVWLGSNYPDPGEYNQDNDTAAMNYILKTSVPFEMVTVRYGKPSGTGAVRVRRKDIYTRMPGLGPVVKEPVPGRHGDTFTCFGDYSVNLFQHIESLDEGCYRSLFDMAAVAIVKDPSWASASEIPCPALIRNEWVEQPGNERTIIVWEDFMSEDILADFYSTLEGN